MSVLRLGEVRGSRSPCQVDDGSVGKFGAEIAFRTRLERELSVATGTPIVTIVIQGGPNTIK